MIETTLFIVICIGLVIGVIVALRKFTDRLRFAPKPITPTPKDDNAFFTVTPNASGTWELHKLTTQDIQNMSAVELLCALVKASPEMSHAIHMHLQQQFEDTHNEHTPK